MDLNLWIYIWYHCEGKSCTAFRDHLVSAVFLSQDNLTFSRFCAWANVPSGNAGTWSYFKVQLKLRGECEPLSSSHSFSESPSFVYSLLKQNLSATLFRLQRNWFSFPFHHLHFFNYHLISSLKAGISLCLHLSIALGFHWEHYRACRALQSI